jgi:hypothetical protein
MNKLTMPDTETRLLRLERQVRILVVLLVTALVTALALGSIAVSNAQPTVIIADDVRAHSFSLLDPTGTVVDHWYSDEKGTYYRKPFPQ